MSIMLILNKTTMSDISLHLKEIKNSYSYNDIELLGFDFNKKLDLLKDTVNSVYDLINASFYEYDNGLSRLDLNYIICEASKEVVNNEVESPCVLENRNRIRVILRIIYSNISNKTLCLYDGYDKSNFKELNNDVELCIEQYEKAIKEVLHKIKHIQEGEPCHLPSLKVDSSVLCQKDPLVEIENLKMLMVVYREKIISLNELTVMLCKIEQFMLKILDVLSSWLISVRDYETYLKEGSLWHGLDKIIIEQKKYLVEFNAC